MPFVTSELANHGVTFTSGQVSTALCAPSRASILRAQYAHRTGVLENRPPDGGAEVFDATSTIATWLQNAGYRTGFVGKYSMATTGWLPASRRAGRSGTPR